jgi:hypothetical protein
VLCIAAPHLREALLTALAASALDEVLVWEVRVALTPVPSSVRPSREVGQVAPASSTLKGEPRAREPAFETDVPILSRLWRAL